MCTGIISARSPWGSPSLTACTLNKGKHLGVSLLYVVLSDCAIVAQYCKIAESALIKGVQFVHYQFNVEIGKMTHVEFASTHFAEGRFRRAYMGTYLKPLSKYGDKCVVKEKKDAYVWDSTGWDVTEEMYKKAQELSQSFNSLTTWPITFTDVEVLQVTSKADSTRGPKLNEYVIAEDYIEGTFKKWCNNYGFISSEAENTAITMPAFMHWSWVQSSGQLMIADLQGVRKNNRYTLTDPAINSVYGKYGATDMRAEGMAMFFLRHRCNDICNHLPKPTVQDFVGIIPQKDLTASLALLQQVRDATTYTNELKFTPQVRTGIAQVFKRVAEVAERYNSYY